MMIRHFALSSELTGAIAIRLPHAKNQPSTPGSFFNLFVTSLLLKLDYCLFVCFNIYTVEPVYNDHPRDWTKLAVIHR